MSDKIEERKVTIDGKEYNLDELSEKAKKNLASLQFVDTQINQLNNEWAISDTARIGYMNALKKEIKDTADTMSQE